jgi:hypothetical protein
MVAVYLLGTVLGGIRLAGIALHPPVNPLSPEEEAGVKAAANTVGDEFESVTLKTPDGLSLRGWFMLPPDANGDAVVLLHGVSDNRLGMYDFATWLLKNRYAVLLPDARGHGLSSGFASYGIREADDIREWVNWLKETHHPRCVFGLGESMGAAQLLESLPKEPRFCAVVAESPFASFREAAYARFGREFRMGPWLGSTFFRPTIDAGFLYVRLRYGLNLEDAAPKRAVQGSRVPILLIDDLEDDHVPPFHPDEIHAENPSDIVVWKVPDAAHIGARRANPQEFEQKVLDWLQSHQRR